VGPTALEMVRSRTEDRGFQGERAMAKRDENKTVN